MGTNKETGHAVNATNFIEKVNVVSRFKEEYHPTNPSISLEKLLVLRDEVRMAVENVFQARIDFTTAAENRRKAYVEMNALASRAINILKSTEAKAHEIKAGKALLAKFKSRPKGASASTPGKKAENSSTDAAPHRVSVSQLGYVNRLQHFKNIILFLKTVTAYNPLEEELSVKSLETFAAHTAALNNERNKASEKLSLAIDARDRLIYAEDSGAIALINKMQAYVLGSFSKESSFYKELIKYPIKRMYRG